MTGAATRRRIVVAMAAGGVVLCAATLAATGARHAVRSRAAWATRPAPPPQALHPAPEAQRAGGALYTAHPEHIQPGLALAHPLALPRNPYEGNRQAIATGATLFVAYNCADCHGSDGSGAMAPALGDGRWHFGGGAAEVFESIYQGRPDGMPSWGGRLSDDQIWMLVAYVRSLSRGKQVSTENFTGRTVARTGH